MPSGDSPTGPFPIAPLDPPRPWIQNPGMPKGKPFPLPNAPEDLKPQFATLFKALDKLNASHCDCNDLLPALVEISNQLMFLYRMVQALHPRPLPEPPPIHGQHWVP